MPQNDAVTVSEDVPFSSSISLLANDSDVDGDSLSVVAGTFVTAQGGSIVIAADGSYTYSTVTFTPDADFNGVATFSYTVTDGNLVSNTATVTVNVAPVNDAPVAQNDAVTVSEDVQSTVSVPWKSAGGV
ncbi:cadherin-like domain-containing protein [Pseudomonas stutzeri]|nr:cadherin-like domain-containing protein [Stutzerimonas stutzeri]